MTRIQGPSEAHCRHTVVLQLLLLLALTDNHDWQFSVRPISNVPQALQVKCPHTSGTASTSNIPVEETTTPTNLALEVHKPFILGGL
jgi:hypothetical protein